MSQNTQYFVETTNLNQADLVFVVDTTGSMAPFIDAAQRHMISMLHSLVDEREMQIKLRVAVVEYRDHPPQEKTFIYKAHAFTSSLKKAQKTIEKLKPHGGGDQPEAVYDGLRAACTELDWRRHASRLAILVGDAPPHGTGFRGDTFSGGCPCGLTQLSTAAIVEGKNVILYTLGLTQVVTESFAMLARLTGGEFFTADLGDAAIESIQEVMRAEFSDLEFDHQVIELCRTDQEWTIDSLCLALESSRGRVSESLSRLGRRDLLIGTIQ